MTPVWVRIAAAIFQTIVATVAISEYMEARISSQLVIVVVCVMAAAGGWFIAIKHAGEWE